MFETAHGWGIAPSEFWSMTLSEWYHLAESHVSQQGVAGTSLTEERLAQLEAFKQEARQRVKSHASRHQNSGDGGR